MNNIERAAEIIMEKTMILGDSITRSRDRALLAARALRDAGLLAPDPRIIRTREELEALDPDTIVITPDRDDPVNAWGFLADINYDDGYADGLPAVVVASGAQVRAASTALQEATE